LENLTAGSYQRAVNGKPVKIVASARSQEKADALAKARRIGTIVLDFDKPQSFQAALKGVDALWLATGYSADMMQQSKFLVDAAVAAGVKHLVHLGADATGASALVGHIAWHLLVESYITSQFSTGGRTFSLLHPAMFLSNLYSYNGRPWFNPKTSLIAFPIPPYGVVAWIDTWDIAEVGARCLLDPSAHGGKTYKLAGECAPIDEVCEVISKTLGKKIGYEIVPAERFMQEAVESTPNDYFRLAYIQCVANMARTSQVRLFDRDILIDSLTVLDLFRTPWKGS
jgi:uncharacterized protein YbjT (DUF2867 family)